MREKRGLDAGGGVVSRFVAGSFATRTRTSFKRREGGGEKLACGGCGVVGHYNISAKRDEREISCAVDDVVAR